MEAYELGYTVGRLIPLVLLGAGLVVLCIVLIKRSNRKKKDNANNPEL